MIIDTHVHYDDRIFDEDREQLLGALRENNIGAVINVGSTAESLPKIRRMIREYDHVYAAIGLHPDEIGDLTKEVLKEMREDMKNPKVLAVGEIGLDYYWNKEAKEDQKEAFRRQILLAREAGKPIAVHSREAAEDTLAILREMYGEIPSGSDTPCRRGVIHCYSYSAEMARILTRKLGFYLGIGGVVTFKNAKKLKEVVADTPLEYLVLETDSPYLAPVPYRGKRNSSLCLPYVVDAIAELKGVESARVERVTRENAEYLFNLKTI